MYHSDYSFLVGPLVGWLATVSILVVVYLGSLVIEEKRRHRRMNEQRQRLGLL